VAIWVFFAAAALAIGFAIIAVAHRSPVINVLALVVMFFAMAVIFAIVGMDFLAAIQVIVYSGAVLVLFLFAIMLLNLRKVDRLGSGRRLQAFLGALAAIGLGGGIVTVAARLSPAPAAVIAGAEHGTAKLIGQTLIGTHLFAFEFVSVLLVAAIIGAVYLARPVAEQPARREENR